MRKKIQIFVFSFALLVLASYWSTTDAQVTIGTSTAPVSGSLLQLKENDGTNNNSTRGLGLPRVKLTDKNKLQPMYSYADDANTPNATALEAHTGLVVYHIDKCTMQGAGLYLWDGAAWQSLREGETSLEGMAKNLGTAQDVITSNGVAWHKDHEGNIFFSMNYDAINPTGNTNRWMTTNLATKTYGARTDGTSWGTSGEPTLTNTYANNPSPYTDAYWAYPNPNGSTAANSATTYNARQRLGLLYNYAAANGNQNPSTADQSVTDPNHAGVQGICPKGWHLPTDLEWTQLETMIKAKASKYSSLADGTTNSGFAMMDMCEPTVGKNSSNTILNGGFSALLAGYAYNGNSYQLGITGYFWSSSSSNNNTNATWWRWVRSGISTVNRDRNTRGDLFSVRCKKDEVSVKVSPSISQQYVKNGTDYATPLTTQLTSKVLATSNTNVIWTSADPTIAAVDANGLVTSVKSGRTTITATTVDGGKTASADIVVGCGAYTAANKWTAFMCHNLGATATLNPFAPAKGLHGNYYAYGKKTQVATVDTPSGVITGWQDETTVADASAWGLPKTVNDPCPTGWRIPTPAELTTIHTNNTITAIGTPWTTSDTNFSTGKKYGDYLFLPAAGYRDTTNGAKGTLAQRGSGARYWSSNKKNLFFYETSGNGGLVTGLYTHGFSVRCVSE